MSRSKVAVVLSAVLLSAVSFVTPGEVKTSPSQRYLVLATKKTSTMQQELNQAVSQGFRLHSGVAAGESELVYALERAFEPVPNVEYLVLATSRESTMERELNAAAAEGYVLSPGSVVYADCELVLVMERRGREEDRTQYLVLATERLSTFQKEIDGASDRGFDLLALAYTDENVAILGRTVHSPGDSIPAESDR